MDNILYEAQTTFQFDYFQVGVNVILLAFTGTIFVKCRGEKYKDTVYEVVKVISAFAFCFLLLVNGLSIINSIDRYKNIGKQYGLGNYKIVEGVVENFVPMPYEGHSEESFEINGVEFSYSDYKINGGYNNARSHFGVIEGDGQHLKIGYVYYKSENIIVYIEQLE